jgi:hypothetical protein
MRPAVLAAAILAAACAAGGSTPTRPAETVFDVSVGCSTTRNPNGVWQYGYTVGPDLVPSADQRRSFLPVDDN